MPRKRFDKKNAQTFSVVHRSHEDALYFDNDASKHVLIPAAQRAQAASGTLSQLKARKAGKQTYSTQELESTLGKEAMNAMRANEGLAAQYGIFFDDSNYDYMQHLRPIGGGGGDSVFIEAKKPKEESKKSIESLIKDVLPSEQTRKVAFDDEENIPAELLGFNPEMDPRLREVMEALEDEAYVAEAGEGEVEDADFLDLLQSGEVDDEEDFYDDYEGDDWDLDNYQDEFDDEAYDSEHLEELDIPYNEGEAPEEVIEAAVPAVSNAWERDFMKFKKETKNAVNEWDSDNEFEDEEEDDVVGELPSINTAATGKKKSKNKLRKKMGAMTDTSSFSMSSSALFRTEGLTLLDDRYEQLNKKFEEEDPYMKEQEDFDMSKERPDFEDMLDDFLDNYELDRGGRKLVKKDREHESIKAAADAASKSKLAARRKKEKDSNGSALDKLGGSFGKMKI
ncbi:hypothetical protein FT663_01893 [Candidozyma haemuli var. vulneris]|nr:hypothetical protein FT662_02036 [[Candida] haemuloni var. vulneris]KAF3993389.1 hypothetical protein FT663_01893 [[Candida] haemuloni var. vulneris]